MFKTYANTIMTATRMSQFTRPLPSTERDLRHRAGDREEREREARYALRRFNFWI